MLHDGEVVSNVNRRFKTGARYVAPFVSNSFSRTILETRKTALTVFKSHLSDLAHNIRL